MLSNRDAFFRIRDDDQIGRGDHWEINFVGLEESRRQRRNLRKQRGQQPKEDVQGQYFEEPHHAASLAAPSMPSWHNEALMTSSTTSLAGSVDRLGTIRYGRSPTPCMGIRSRLSSSLSRNASPVLPDERGETSGPVFLYPPPRQFSARKAASGGWFAAQATPQNAPQAPQAFDVTLGGSSLMHTHPTFSSLSGMPRNPGTFDHVPSPAVTPSLPSPFPLELGHVEPLSSQTHEEDFVRSQSGSTPASGRKGKGPGS